MTFDGRRLMARHLRPALHRGLPTLLALAACLAMVIPLAACGGGKNRPGQGGRERLTVVTSIRQWQALASQIGGDQVRVKAVLTNASADAHDYEPTTADIAAIGRADLVLVNGADHDAWASKAAQASGITMVDVAQESGRHSGDNPHLWFSSEARRSAASALNTAYKQMRTGHDAYFDSLLRRWQAREDELSQRVGKARGKLSGAEYAATESVAAYLAQDLGLKDITPAGYRQAAVNGGEPSPADINEFEDILRTGRARALVFNEMEANGITDQLTGTAMTSRVPIVRVGEQMPEDCKDLEEWMGRLVDEFSKALS